ncbi:hypothetical protein HPP92_023305 [Vanilla planifolia]|nr:hypothetical protein HPP92_023305 [Vanilla planifolia]
MEELLINCAHAIESNDATLAQQILWVLNNIASPDGDSNQRLTSAILRSLILRASRSGSAIASTIAAACTQANTERYLLRLSAVALANFIDLTPWHRFGFSAANSAIANITEGYPVLHLVDLTTTHSMQIPTLIDALAARLEGPPFIRLTVPSSAPHLPPPSLDISIDELGSRLVNFARSRNVEMEFRVVPSSPEDGFELLVEQLRLMHQLVGGHEGEVLVINCHMMGHCIPEETAANSQRGTFLKAVRSLEPSLVVLVDEEADFTGCTVVDRLRAVFNYLWIPFDTIDTFLLRGASRGRSTRRRFVGRLRT